jgi:hypothetical protein
MNGGTTPRNLGVDKGNGIDEVCSVDGAGKQLEQGRRAVDDSSCLMRRLGAEASVLLMISACRAMPVASDAQRPHRGF